MSRTFRIPAVPYGQSVHPAPERVDSKRITLNGKRQTIHLCAYGWETRYSWGHSAYCPEVGVSAKVRYYNRTWECHRFDSVITELLYNVRMTDEKFRKAERRKARALKARALKARALKAAAKA